MTSSPIEKAGYYQFCSFFHQLTYWLTKLYQSLSVLHSKVSEIFVMNFFFSANINARFKKKREKKCVPTGLICASIFEAKVKDKYLPSLHRPLAFEDIYLHNPPQNELILYMYCVCEVIEPIIYLFCFGVSVKKIAEFIYLPRQWYRSQKGGKWQLK